METDVNSSSTQDNPHESQGRDFDLGDDAMSPEEVEALERAFANGGDSVEVTGDVAALVESLERERDEALAARTRALADYANFQKRSAENETKARTAGQMSVVRALLPMIEHFDLALGQDPETTTAEQLLGGVGMVKRELLKTFETFGVKLIEPEVGDEFNAMRHEAMLHQEADDIEPGHIVAVFQPGFAAGDLVLRPAKVAIAPEA